METGPGKLIVARLRRVLPVAAIGLALAGCFAHTGHSQRAQRPAINRDRNRTEDLVARAEQRWADKSPAPKATQVIQAKQESRPVLSSAVDPQERLAALAKRAELRAYFGAPPVIPHEIDQFDSEAECLACHGLGPDSDDANPKRPHRDLASCTQCHVIAELDLFIELEGAGNGFEGLPEPTGGSRAWVGAPPTIPHSTLMRDHCLSCHGPSGLVAIRSSHPQRLNCQQCHAPSAKLNQRQASDAPMFLKPPSIGTR